MIESWCCYHKPHPIKMGEIDDGQPEVLRSDGICEECLKREMAKLQKKRDAGTAGSPPMCPGPESSMAGVPSFPPFGDPPPLPTDAEVEALR